MLEKLISLQDHFILDFCHFDFYRNLRFYSSTNIYDYAWNCNLIQITLVLGVLWQIGLILISNVTSRIKEENEYDTKF